MPLPSRWKILPWACGAAGIALSAASVRAADPAPFELGGPGLRITVMRGKDVLPIAQVPSLAEGDRLSIGADLPEDQGARFLLLSTFLRGATNPPPKDWIKSAETWKKKAKDNSLSLTVPKGARQMTLFLVPDTGGAEGTIEDAVRGKPGEFIRATQELNQASLDRSRLDAFMAAIRAQENTHPEYLRSVAPALARSLSMKLNDECLSKVVELQANCLLENREQLVLADVHSSSIAETLTGAPTDLALQLSSTREAGYGFYSPYIGVVRDLAKIFGAFSNPEFDYLPTLSVRRDDAAALLLNKAPSFQKPKSVLVVGMPAIEADSPPRLRSAASGPICAARPGVVLPVEGAPLIYSTAYARNMTVKLTAASGETIDLPLEARADRGGYVVKGNDPLPAVFKGTVKGHLSGYWGFERFEGPDFSLQLPGDARWKVAGEEPTLVVGRDNGLTLTGEAPACVEGVTLRQGDGAPQSLPWKVQGTDALLLTLPLADRKPGDIRIEVKYQGVATPSVLSLKAYAQASRLDALSLHAGDNSAVLSGQRLDQVAAVELSGMVLAPGELVRDGSVDRLRLLTKGEGAALKAGDRATARVRLKDGRSVDLAATVEEARPRLALLSRSVSQGTGAGRSLQLSGEDLLPDDGRLVFSVRAEQGAAFRPDDALEVASADGAKSVRLGSASGLRLSGPDVMVATLDPAALAPASGPLRFRLLRGDGSSDWQPLVTLARLPHIDGVSCEAQDCTIKGRDLFLIEAVDGAPGFEKPTMVTQGFTGSSLSVPAPRDGKFYIRLRDARDQAVILDLG
ncbi:MULTISPECIES: hypothetical protein [Sphingobium]|uniref:Uncharacterized protein n=1 Tax=Sphingobium fuliginis (strain ATCC 27551) TaxID=336203 RepID=A0ABQ1FCY0_SPHSA|nr:MULTISPECIES: hypothetical protein [Sphingobium]RYL95515.1 hypothetical protein EWH10_21185 [Sphingobium fuliginis]WDA36011.1 hypothetical protein PO876_21595 [Sphingobium sp. YC-XJ3]GGA06939.1 hypothetical protein GCM10019071_41920 [Sphingobium fuliginis]